MHAVCQVKHLRAVLVSILFVGLGWNFEDDRRSIPEGDARSRFHQ